MIPTGDGAILGGAVENTTASERPTLTYRIDFEAGRVRGTVEQLDAMRQAVYKILRTQRFAWLIYSWDYGAELGSVSGKSAQAAESELGRILREALLQDSRITDVQDLTVTRTGRRSVLAAFTAVTIFGALEEEVTLNV